MQNAETSCVNPARFSKPEHIRVPVEATYKVKNGVAIKVSANYADVPTGRVAEMLARAFHLEKKR